MLTLTRLKHHQALYHIRRTVSLSQKNHLLKQHYHLLPQLLVSSDASLEDTSASSISSDTTSFSTFSSSLSVSNSSPSSLSTLATAGMDFDVSIAPTEIPSGSLSHSSNGFILTTEAPSQTTESFTPALLSQDSCYAEKECTNGTDCCVPHVEWRCHRQNKTADYRKSCKAIVFEENNNNSFVIAIAINDKKVIVIKKQSFFCVAVIYVNSGSVVADMITACFVIVTYRKIITITFRMWYLSMKKYTTDSQRKQWEGR